MRSVALPYQLTSAYCRYGFILKLLLHLPSFNILFYVVLFSTVLLIMVCDTHQYVGSIFELYIIVSVNRILQGTIKHVCSAKTNMGILVSNRLLIPDSPVTLKYDEMDVVDML